MTELLQACGYRVLAVARGEEAVAALENQAGPDLIICDDRLGDGTRGVETVRALREEFGRGVPALLVAGEVDGETLREAAGVRAAGAAEAAGPRAAAGRRGRPDPPSRASRRIGDVIRRSLAGCSSAFVVF